MMQLSLQQTRRQQTSRPPPLRARKVRFTKSPQQLRYTIKIMGEAARNASHYLPIIKHAQKLASRAGPKDYLGQVKQIYDDIVKRWRYVFDPVDLELVHVSGPALYGEVLGFNRTDTREHGAGDCDDIASLSLGMLSAIGLPVVIKTVSPPRETGALFSHTYAKVKIPKMGWLAFDPVGHPDHRLGWEPPHNREATWDLKGNLLGYKGRFPKSFGRMFSGLETLQGGIEMQEQDQYQDYGLGAYATESNQMPLDWAKYGLLGFGAYSSQMGIIDGEQSPLLMEHDQDDIIPYQGMGLVRTKMLELAPVDWELVRRYGAPRMGAAALGDDGSIYQYQRMPGQHLGFFKKIFSAVKKGVKWVGSKAKSLISKLPGGKYLVRMYDKLHKVSMKLVRPLARLVGKAAGPLSKIAAFVPGYGPAIAVALQKAGKIAKVLKKTGVTRDKSGKPKFKSDKQAKRFKKELEKEADKMKRKKKRKKKEKIEAKLKKKLKRDIRKKLEAKLRREYEDRARRTAPQPKQGRMVKAGTPEHVAYMEGLGFSMDIEA